MDQVLYTLADPELRPWRAHDTDAGWDLKARLDEMVTLPPIQAGVRMIIPTGVKLQMPKTLSAVIRPRSGLSFAGLHIYHGTIDPSYRGEIKVVVQNLGNHPLEIHPRARICQIVFQPVCAVELLPSLVLEPSDRGEAGFGSSGI